MTFSYGPATESEPTLATGTPVAAPTLATGVPADVAATLVTGLPPSSASLIAELFNQSPIAEPSYAYDSAGTGGRFLVSYVTTPAQVVASAGAPEALRAVADYVCDGVADDVEIQAALDNLPARGGTVMLSAGNFVIESGISWTTPATRLIGHGGVTGLEGDPLMGTSLSGNITDPLLTYDTSTASAHDQGPSIHNINFHRTDATQTSTLVRIAGTNRYSLSECGFRDGAIGLHLDSSVRDTSWGTLHHCFFRNNAVGLQAGNNSDTASLGARFVMFGGGFICGANDKGIESFRFPFSVFGTKFDGPGATGAFGPMIHIHGQNAAISGIQMEWIRDDASAVGILVERDFTGESGRGISLIGNTLSGNGTSGTAVKFDTDASLCKAIGNHFVTIGTGIELTASTASCVVSDNAGTAVQTFVDDSGSNNQVRNNPSWITEASGTGSIASGGTSDVVTHGLAVTPTVDDISITLSEDSTNTPGAIWVDTITSTQFTVNCENDPGASNLDFGWRAVVL